MRFWKSWIVTQKDLSVIRKNKYVFYSLIAMPVILGVILPAIFVFALNAEVTSLPHAQFIAAANQLINMSATVPHRHFGNSALNHCLLQFCWRKN